MMGARLPEAPMTLRCAALLALALAAAAPAARAADVAAEVRGAVLSLPPPSPHWFWIGDLLYRRSALVDADSGRFLGMLSSGVGVIAPSLSAERGEIYLPETYYSRGSRGVRTDVVTVYDATPLPPIAQIALPPQRADLANAAR